MKPIPRVYEEIFDEGDTRLDPSALLRGVTLDGDSAKVTSGTLVMRALAVKPESGVIPKSNRMAVQAPTPTPAPAVSQGRAAAAESAAVPPVPARANALAMSKFELVVCAVCIPIFGILVAVLYLHFT